MEGVHWTPSEQKVIAELHPKENTVLDHVLLRCMLTNGFKGTNIHRARQFELKSCLEMFINTFLSKRLEAKTSRSEIFKLILKSGFGKMCESAQ